MQTFLPHPSFDESARVLDGPRLGTQRVETLVTGGASPVPAVLQNPRRCCHVRLVPPLAASTGDQGDPE